MLSIRKSGHAQNKLYTFRFMHSLPRNNFMALTQHTFNISVIEKIISKDAAHTHNNIKYASAEPMLKKIRPKLNIR